MFIAPLFTEAEVWKQPKGPSIDKWIKKMWYIYSGPVLSLIKEGNPVVINDMDETGQQYAT